MLRSDLISRGTKNSLCNSQEIETSNLENLIIGVFRLHLL